MPLVVKDRVQETSTTTGTGTFTLAGAVSGFQSFSVIGNGNTTYYAIVGGTEWEVGLGTYTSSGTTLSRNTILESSNGGTAVNFSAGTKNVFVTYPAEKGLYLDASNKVLVNTSTARANFFNSTSSPIVQVEGTSFDTSSLSVVRNSDAATAPFLVLGKARGATVESNTIVQSGDAVGSISFQGNDGTEFVEAARITGLINGTPGANDMPGALTFATTADGAASPTEQARITSAGLLQFNSGYGSVVTAYGCRAWVNFNGIGTVAIRGSGNISSITDNGTGDYTLNFATAMTDINYSYAGAVKENNSSGADRTDIVVSANREIGQTTRLRVSSFVTTSGNRIDAIDVCVSVFR